jgi:hypothetical protein
VLLVWALNALALGCGVGLGIRGLIDPHWAARLVRLQQDEQGGGFAEFRATYGGVFLGVHAAALLLSLQWIVGREPFVGAVAAGACLSAAGGWAGAAIGRTLSIWRDSGANTPFNRLSIGIETAMAVLIGGPWLVWLLGA